MEEKQSILNFRIIFLLLFFIVLLPFFPLLISRRWGWWEAWIYGMTSVVGFIISRFLASKQNPDILAERSKFMQHENTQSWDKKLAPFSGLGGGLIPLIAGLDALFGWSGNFNLSIKIAAFIIFFTGFIISSYALITNRFFSGTVRLQPERGHHVIDKGPYAWVRHPGYIGAILTYLVSAVILDSVWVFIPAFLVTIVLIVRTSLEDRFLKENLEGYLDYSKKVPYRMIPRIW